MKRNRPKSGHRRSPGKLCAWIGLLASIFSAPVSAQLDWSDVISIELKEASLRETLASFAKVAGGRAWIDPEVEGKVTLSTEGAPAIELLDGICRDHELQCYWGGRDPQLLVAPATGFRGFATHISLRLRKASLQQTVAVMETISEGALRVEGELSGQVTVEILSAPWPVALSHLCEDVGCEIDWRRRPAVVRPASAPRVEVNGSLDDLDTVLRDLMDAAPEATWGAKTWSVEGVEPRIRPSSVRATDGAAEQSIEISESSWGGAMGSLCRRLLCRWQIRYDRPSRVLLTWLVPEAENRVRLGSAEEFSEPQTRPAQALAELLANEVSAELLLSPGIELKGEVKVRHHEMEWLELADQLCAVVHCHWSLDEQQLRLTPSEAPLSLTPAATAPPVNLTLFFEGADGTEATENVELDWRNPVLRRRLVAPSENGETSVGRLLGAWIPFSADRQWVVPIWRPCGDGASRVMNPVEVVARRARLSVPFVPVAGDESSSKICAESSGDEARVAVSLVETEGRRYQFDLGPLWGTYALLGPTSSAGSAANHAVIFLGSSGKGGGSVDVLWVTLQPDGRPEVRRLSLSGPLRESLNHGDKLYGVTLAPL